MTPADSAYEHQLRESAEQQPDWEDVGLLDKVREELRELPGLVSADEAAGLHAQLAKVATGGALLLQAGDCAEDPAESTFSHVVRKTELIHAIADVLSLRSSRPVVRVGRIAGQFAKPRSRPTEVLPSGLELPVYRGHMVNDPAANPDARRADPKRLLSGYLAASSVTESIRVCNTSTTPERAVWTSHEALLLDYELPLVRHHDGTSVLTSTHWPWIGNRTRHPDRAHVAMLAGIVNPLACKIGPGATPVELTRLCARLDPHRIPGRLTLTARMGADLVAERLPALVAAVRNAGHPVIWLCDPLHGNTTARPDGRKIRYIRAVVREIQSFISAVLQAGGVPGGLHLETTPDAVAECTQCENDVLEDNSGIYTTFCDPRLNAAQAVSVVSAWPEGRVE